MAHSSLTLTLMTCLLATACGTAPPPPPQRVTSASAMERDNPAPVYVLDRGAAPVFVKVFTLGADRRDPERMGFTLHLGFEVQNRGERSMEIHPGRIELAGSSHIGREIHPLRTSIPRPWVVPAGQSSTFHAYVPLPIHYQRQALSVVHLRWGHRRPDSGEVGTEHTVFLALHGAPQAPHHVAFRAPVSDLFADGFRPRPHLTERAPALVDSLVPEVRPRSIGPETVKRE